MEDIQFINLVRLAQAGDRDAMGRLVEAFEPTVFGIVLRRLRNRAEAAEVTQEVFLRAVRKLDQLRDPARFPGWLKRIAVRLAINRAVRRPKETISAPETFDGVKCAPDHPIDGLMRVERADRVRSGLSRLRPLDRDTLIAFYFEGQSLKEMSDRFSSPVGTIKRRLHTARHRLKAALTDVQPA
ncbi:MAG: sigma-70 family RNA polymerase sigma factor [Planctomycetota bacterium]|nr:MAG: sigma-70 family RNA polymerase sigma factor [Planctomycetota bacterium]REK26142.1 MAG: sigma-70 family RNA polymerase sigma factor [Planctomycetota bacterium]REK33511.1 MAG: sigma-70 family RNA polymerase sigma factor [Planctomycetota bacterium]